MTKLSFHAREKALGALDGMGAIVAREALVKGTYAEPDRKFSDAICHGHRYCALGSLWAGAGHVPKRAQEGYMEGIEQEDRDGFFRYRPGLKAAYDALNTATEDFVEKHDLHRHIDHDFDAPLEGLFEGSLDVGRIELLEIIGNAKLALVA